MPSFMKQVISIFNLEMQTEYLKEQLKLQLEIQQVLEYEIIQDKVLLI
jgi:hypothetical protein